MARSVIAVALLGLLACAALASAQETAELMKNRKYGGHDDKEYKPEEKEYERDDKEYEHDKHYKPEHKEYEHEKPKYKPEGKPEWPVQVIKAPHLLNCADMTLEIDSPEWTATGQAVGSVGVLSFDIKAHGKVVGHADLTGVATHVDVPTGSFVMNSLLTIQAMGEDMEDTAVTAQGIIAWDGVNNQISKEMNTLVITGGKGKAAGADGTIALSGGLDNTARRSIDIKMTVPKTKDSKEKEHKHEERN